MIASLMRSRRFAPMFWCQFFAALGDNLLKNTLALLVLFELGKEEGGSAATLAGALFILPSFFLSALGGELAFQPDALGIRTPEEFVGRETVVDAEPVGKLPLRASR